MEIVACFDMNFVMPTGVMMYSVCANNDNSDITFHLVVDESVSEKDKKDLEETISPFKGKKTTFYTINSQHFREMPALSSNKRLNQSTYYRLILSEILPRNLNKVLYLDGDVIVRHSLLPLWNTDLTGYAVAAVTDPGSGDIRIYNRLRYPSLLGYFNAGVMLINLDYWRSNDVNKAFNNYVNTHRSDIVYHDQDVLNVLFQNDKLTLHIKYNLMTSFLSRWPKFDYWKYEQELLEALSDPIVVHLAGTKPWEYQRFPHPYTSSFIKYQRQTKWKNYPIRDKRPIKLRVRHFIADALRKAKFRPPLPSIFIDVSPID